MKGRLKGAVTTYKEVGFPFDEVVQRIADHYGFSLNKAEEKVTEYWQWKNYFMTW